MIRTGGFVLERREPREYDVSGPGSGSSSRMKLHFSLHFNFFSTMLSKLSKLRGPENLTREWLKAIAECCWLYLLHCCKTLATGNRSRTDIRHYEL